MKSFAFACIVAVCSAVDLEWGYAPRVSYKPVSYLAKPAQDTKAASVGYGKGAQKSSASDWDAYSRDQDLSIDESYGKTNAKSYRAISFDEWDNKDNDKWGAQAWGQDRDAYGASSASKRASRGDYGNYGKAGAAGAAYSNGHAYGAAHQAGRAYGADKSNSASAYGEASKAGYDNDVWAKQAHGSDFDSRWGKSYDEVEAKSYDNENYMRHVQADDDQWAEDYDRLNKGTAGAYGHAASKGQSTGYGWGKRAGPQAASAAYGAEKWGKSASDWDAYGSDKDYSEKIKYDRTDAKSYRAISFDEWDNKDDDAWGAQSWGKDRDVYGASSYGKAASARDVDAYGRAGYGAAAYGASKHGSAHLGHGHGWGKGYGGKVSYGANAYGAAQGGAYGKAGQVWQGASKAGGAAAGAYDNDEQAQQAYGRDFDSRWGKSYDSVSAKAYKNESFSRDLQADDDQWAEDYDRYDDKDAGAYGAAASAKGGLKGHGWGYQRPGSFQAASKAGYGAKQAVSGSDWDAYGRDQDLSVQESYDATWAKSYEAESMDAWDNKDDDKFGAQKWSKDRDLYGQSSYGAAASEKDADAYGKGAYGAAQYGANAYGHVNKGHGWGHGLGYGKGLSYNKGVYGAKAAGAKGYGAEKDYGASSAHAAQKGAYDNDEWAKQAYGSDFDSRWGKSFDRVSAKSYDDEQYARKIRADDDQWAEDYDTVHRGAAKGYGAAASKSTHKPAVYGTTYKPVYSGYKW